MLFCYHMNFVNQVPYHENCKHQTSKMRVMRNGYVCIDILSEILYKKSRQQNSRCCYANEDHCDSMSNCLTFSALLASSIDLIHNLRSPHLCGGTTNWPHTVEGMIHKTMISHIECIILCT